MTNVRRQMPKPNRFCIEFTLDDPAALDQEWNYTDRATRVYQAGQRLLLRGFFAEAADVFERATRYDRAHYDAYVGRTEALILSGQDVAAAQVANDALERYGRNCRLGAARGHVFLHQQDLENARACTDIATRNAPESAYVWVIAGEVRVASRPVLRDGTLKSAMDCFARARAAAEPWDHTPLRIALALLEWGQLEHARRSLDAILKVEPDLPLAWILLGDALKLMGDKRDWRECYRRAAELVPELEPVRRALGWKPRMANKWRGLRRSAGQFLRR